MMPPEYIGKDFAELIIAGCPKAEALKIILKLEEKNIQKPPKKERRNEKDSRYTKF